LLMNSRRIVLGGLISLQHEYLIEDHTPRPVPRVRIATLRIHIALGARRKEAARASGARGNSESDRSIVVKSRAHRPYSWKWRDHIVTRTRRKTAGLAETAVVYDPPSP
jgi:hypothetical protein